MTPIPSFPNNSTDISQVPTTNPFTAQTKLISNTSTHFYITNDKISEV